MTKHYFFTFFIFFTSFQNATGGENTTTENFLEIDNLKKQYLKPLIQAAVITKKLEDAAPFICPVGPETTHLVTIVQPETYSFKTIQYIPTYRYSLYPIYTQNTHGQNGNVVPMLPNSVITSKSIEKNLPTVNLDTAIILTSTKTNRMASINEAKKLLFKTMGKSIPNKFITQKMIKYFLSYDEKLNETNKQKIYDSLKKIELLIA